VGPATTSPSSKVPTPKGRVESHVMFNPRHQSNVPSRVSSPQTVSAGSGTSIVSTKRDGAEARNVSSTAGSITARMASSQQACIGGTAATALRR
jgi:hypothetical protein